MRRINVYGAIIPNDYKWYYSWFGEDCTCPRDVGKTLEDANGEDIEVYINSPGGVISAGSEIYTLLRSYKGDVKIYVVGQACSAASIIAMARHCEMSPTALMMVHCVSTYVSGNHADLEHTAEVLRTADEALSSAYVTKTGKSRDEVLEMMEKETWLNAEQAKEHGLIDAIMFKQNETMRLTACGFELPSEEKINRIRIMINERNTNKGDSAFLISKLSLLRLKGEKDE